MPATVIELPEYIKRASSLLNGSECEKAISNLAEHPKSDRNMLSKLVGALVSKALEKSHDK